MRSSKEKGQSRYSDGLANEFNQAVLTFKMNNRRCSLAIAVLLAWNSVAAAEIRLGGADGWQESD